MNIFILARKTSLSASYHCNKHCVKMILEYSQLLSTAHKVLDGESCPIFHEIYKATHENHPCAKWVRQSSENYAYLLDLLFHLHLEYSMRYNKVHASYEIYKLLNQYFPININRQADLTLPPICCPPTVKILVAHNNPSLDTNSWEFVIACYRTYYLSYKSHILKWKNFTTQPMWVTNGQLNGVTKHNIESLNH